ncbi:MAG: hypothetical protein AAGD35_17710 [Actinomycetota bacterium]
MSRAKIERKLRNLSQELSTLRNELRVIDEQLQYVVGEADDARLRSLVSETPLAAQEHREAAKTVNGVRKDREARVKRMAKLEERQDALLDELGRVGS